MEPYYADDFVTIYHGDCLELIDSLAFDVVVTDPPYGRNWKQGDTNSRRGWASDVHQGIENDESTSVRDDALLLTSCPCVVFGDLLVPPPKGTKCVLIFDKGGDAGFVGAVGGYRRNVEAVFLVGPHGSGLGGRSAILRSVESCGGNLARTTGHPHTKPLDLMRSLIENAPPGVILDPFMGSGTTLRAAKDLGRKAIGVEIDERYCEIAARRMGQEVLDFGGVS